MNEKLLRELDRRKIHQEFNMSYDGSGWHDWMHGVSGAEKAVDRAFALCRDMGFPTGAEMCLHQRNKHTLRESVEHMGSLGVRSVKTVPVSMAVMLGGFFMADPRKPDEFNITSYKLECEPETFCMCGHARLYMYISPDGVTLPCMSLSGLKIQERFPNLLKQGLAKCITDSYYMNIINMRASEYFAVRSECRECKFSRCCYGGCRADALTADESDLMGKSPAACELFRGGWIERIIEAVRKARPSAKSPLLENSVFQKHTE